MIIFVNYYLVGHNYLFRFIHLCVFIFTHSDMFNVLPNVFYSEYKYTLNCVYPWHRCDVNIQAAILTILFS